MAHTTQQPTTGQGHRRPRAIHRIVPKNCIFQSIPLTGSLGLFILCIPSFLLSIMLVESSTAKVNTNGGVFHPGHAYGLPDKIRIARFPPNKSSLFHLVSLPKQGDAARALRLLEYSKLIKELHQTGGKTPTPALKQETGNQISKLKLILDW
jgi:hypothetical protein